MIRAANFDLRYPRNLGVQDSFTFQSLDLSGANLLMQVRLYPDAPGDALITLETDGLTPNPNESLGVNTNAPALPSVSEVIYYIKTETIQGLPPAGKPGGDAVFYYDLITTGVGSAMFQLVKGKFIIEGSVSRL